MDLSTEYLGLRLPHPLIAGASPLSDSLDSARRLEDAGAAAIVMRSLFEEQITAEALATHASMHPHAESFGEALSYFPTPQGFVLGPHEYLEHLRRLKAAVRVPVMASLNGSTPGGWLEHAKLIEQAGADALELNLYYVATDPGVSGVALERRALEMVGIVRREVRMPIAVKLSPWYTSLAHFARELVWAGASGLVLFNRFFEPDIAVEELEVVSRLELSDPRELLLRLRWLAVLSGQVEASLAVTGGVHSGLDAIKALMCGAHAVQMVSALLLHGPQHLGRVRQDIAAWMQEKGYERLEQMRGCMNLLRCPDPAAFERANYLQTLQTWSS